MTRYNPLTGHNYPTDGAYLRAKSDEARAKRLARQRITRAAYCSALAFFALALHLIVT
jgi:hypothetical protein